MSRFNRQFELMIEADGERVTVGSPFRISFDATKSLSGGLNKMTIQVFNMAERRRLAVVKDPEQRKRLPLSLKVGYNGTLDLIFRGTVHRGLNRREGPDIITELDCLDGGFDFFNSFTSQTVRGDRLGAILRDLSNTRRGKIGEIQKLVRPKVLVGNTVKLIDQIIDEDQSWYIDDEQLNILRDNEVISSFIPLVSAATGLIDTPEREQSKLTFSTLMNPTLKIGGLARLKSTTAPHMNGIYRLETIGYTGDNYGEAWQQTCTGLLARNYRVI